MPDARTCSKCGAPLAGDGSCPRCLIGFGLDLPDDPPTQRTAPTTDQPGDRIGRYKLLEKIGEGGMGIVWMAEQAEPVRRLVALKVVKQGMDSKQVLARFEAERQALALMDHPHIAKVLDAGATSNGHPYFVMELIKGVPLTEFCDEQRLTIRERLELFVPVCQAIQHAHQKGIIHRDLKPSNVLVALYDGQPVPKVIDFGVAKAIGQQLTERTLFTGFGAVIGSLEYMSPEQAELNQLDIDTRSDIYSLGVLLYELLTGSTPLTRETLRQAAFDELLHRVRTEEPPRPSTRLKESKDRLPPISAQRKLDPVRLRKLVRGDLDCITMKCLEKDRARRYETANELAADVQRHLGNRPVVARPSSNFYRFRKMLRRNKLKIVAVSGAAFLLLVIGLIVLEVVMASLPQSSGGYHLRASFTDVQNLKVGDPVKIAGIKVGRVESIHLERSRATVIMRFRNALKIDSTATIKSDGPNGQSHIAVDMGSSNAPYAIAGTYLLTTEELGLAKRRDFLGNEDLDTADSLDKLALAFARANSLPEAESKFREALAIRRKLLGMEHREVVASLENVGEVLMMQSRWSEAETVLREALASARKHGTNDPAQEVAVTARTLHHLAETLRQRKALTEARSQAVEAEAMYRRHPGWMPQERAHSLRVLGAVLGDLGEFAALEPLYREALAGARKGSTNDYSSDLQDYLDDWAEDLEREGKYAEAVPARRALLVSQRTRYPATKDTVIRATSSLGRLLADWAWSERRSAGDPIKSSNESPATPEQSQTSREPARAPHEIAREAERLLRDCLTLCLGGAKVTDWDTAEVKICLGAAFVSTAVTDNSLRSEARLAKFTEAERLLLDGNEGLQHSKSAESKLKRDALTRLIRLYEAWDELDPTTGKAARVIEWKKKLEAFDREAARDRRPKG